MAASPAQRTLNYLRKQGWPHVQVTEVWIPQAKRRRDLFSFCDVLAMHPEWGILFVQTTSYSNVSARLKKIREYATQAVEDALAGGARVEIHGWRKVKTGNRYLWTPRIVDIGLGELYSMEDSDWDKVYKEMQEVFNVVRAHYRQGDYTSQATLMNFPPKIRIAIKPDAGTGDGRAYRFTKKELVEISEIAAHVADKALLKYSWLKLTGAPPPDRHTVSYYLRPKVYAQLAETL